VSGFRLVEGGRIDRARPLAFRFDGRVHTGFAGDTLASALIANGVHLVGRSFKDHRPRGILAAGVDEPNAIVQLSSGARSTPNLRATEIELFDGLDARPVNCWPNLSLDAGALLGRLSRLFVAGFYYKTFMGPPGFWQRLYEPVLRRMAGLGEAPEGADPDRYDHRYAHADLLVVGGGPAGLAAALAAGRRGERVMLVDEQTELGGGLLDLREPPPWLATWIAELAAQPETRLLTRTTAFGYYDHNYLCLLERRTGSVRERLWHVRAKRVVLATGAHERPLVFPNNDRPGVMLAGAVRSYVSRYAAAPGRRALVFANNDGGMAVVDDLAAAGIEVAAAIDVRRDARMVVDVLGASQVEAVRLSDGSTIACDLLAMSGGWNPAGHLFSQAQGRLVWDDATACFVPGAAAQVVRCVGACNGAFTLAEALAEGFVAGGGRSEDAPRVAQVTTQPIKALWLTLPPERLARAGKALVDFQNDVTAQDIALAVREGLHSIEHVKRYTTAGMATDQGKTSNVNALALLALFTGRAIPDVGHTTFRPPYTAVTYGAMAGLDRGPLSDPVRVTPMHDWHAAHGAPFEDVGQWKRPWFYLRDGETREAAVAREALAVRRSLGVLDASTLGKIEIKGRDAARFLDRIYTNTFSNLAIGRCRYGLMCREDGMVFDDGVTTRLAEDRFLMTTTTGGAARVLDWLEEWSQTEWPELELHMTSVTEQWATVALAGPNVRALLAALAPTLPLDKAAFPHLSMREAEVAGMPARVFRISFTGEPSYEINVTADYGQALWDAVMAAGARFDITPYGTETMHLLRAEKGYIIVGQETDGTVTPLDLGMDWIVAKRKDFLGRRSLARADTRRADRKQLVGLLPDDPKAVIAEGTQLVAPEHAAGARRNLLSSRVQDEPAVPSLGHVTSSYWSPNLGSGFALALLKRGRERRGETVVAPTVSGGIRARVVAPVFLDPQGARLDA
jgi:sarcosine oxidase, subunit alpha